MNKAKPEPKGSRFSLTVFLKKNFLTGLAVLFPIFITGYFIFFVFRLADRLTGRYINKFLIENYGYSIPGLGVLAAVAAIFLIGLGYNYFFGKNIFSFFERIINKIPLIGNIYPSAKQLSSFMFTEKGKKDFKKVVLVEFPGPGIYTVGFITNQQIADFDKASGKELICVFVPLAPAPFSGHIIAVTKDKIREMDMSIDRAIKFIVSGGVAFSPEEKDN